MTATGRGLFSAETLGDLVPWSCASLAIAAGLALGSAQTNGVQLWPWLVSIALFGLPHGACDHLVAARIGGDYRSERTTIATAFFPMYLAGGGAMMLLWIASPAVALGLFLGLTAWHWGSADAAAYREGLAAFVLRSAGRGLLVVSAPLAFHPGRSWEALSSLLEIFGPATVAQTPSWLPSLTVGGLVLGLMLECLLVARDAWRLQRRRAARESVELVLLLVLFYLVSPVAAVGVYFVAWHAWRHTLRTGALLDPEKVGRLPALVAAYHGRALPLTLASVVALAALTLAVGWESPQKLTAVYLVLLSALTVPHSVVVSAWDYRSRLARYRSGPLGVR